MTIGCLIITNGDRMQMIAATFKWTVTVQVGWGSAATWHKFAFIQWTKWTCYRNGHYEHISINIHTYIHTAEATYLKRHKDSYCQRLTVDLMTERKQNWLFAMTTCTSLGPTICDFQCWPLTWVQTNVNHSSDDINQPNWQQTTSHSTALISNACQKYH